MFLSTLVILVACCGGGDEGSPTDDQEISSTWTYMVYMGADNDLCDYGFADLNEMEMVGSSANVNIVLQTELSYALSWSGHMDFWQNHLEYMGHTIRMLVQNDTNEDDLDLSSATSIGLNLNSASPDKLSDFITWAKENYPADKYALVIWDHGAGWKAARLAAAPSRGAVVDTTNNSMMTLPELAQAVSDSGVKFDLINFDACFMGMYEVAYEFRGLTDYMVFSEESEPGVGDPYDTILAALNADPTMSGSALAKTIVDKYYEFYSFSLSEDNAAITKSAIDMSKIDSLHQSLTALADGIIEEYDNVSTAISEAQAGTQAYVLPANHDLFDFANYLDQALESGNAKTAAATVASVLDEAIIANQYHGDRVAGSNGLAIYVPTEDQLADGDLSQYGQLACNADGGSTWLDAINMIVENAPDDPDPDIDGASFAVDIQWDTDADVDLFVREPDGTWYDGSNTVLTTPNGQFSLDSTFSGVSEEYYVANEDREAGEYEITINYDGSGVDADYANVSLRYMLDSTGWQEIDPVRMDLSNPNPDDFDGTLEDLNDYSNWWWPMTITAGEGDRSELTFESGNKKFNLHFIPMK